MPNERVMYAMLRTMGDVIVSTTIIREFKRDFPDSDIHFYTDEAYAPLLENNPEISEVKISDHWHWNSIFMAMAWGKYNRVFLPYQVRRECNAWHQFEETRHQHLVDFYWRRMGMHRPILERECYLYPSEENHRKAGEHITFDVPRVALHSTTGVPTKDWPYFEQLVEEFRKAGYGCAQVGGSNDRKINGAVDFRGKMELLELAAFLSKCALFIGLDSGISYMADAMGTPCIIIQGSTNPVTSGPISNRVIHLFSENTGYADCQNIRCHSNCRHEVNCNTRITVDMVLEKAEFALSSWRKPIPVEI